MNRDAIYLARIAELSQEMYPQLLARARNPFSGEETKPFFTTGKPGAKYISVAYRPDRTTKISLGPPSLVLQALSGSGDSIPRGAIGAGEAKDTDTSVADVLAERAICHLPQQSAGVAEPARATSEAALVSATPCPQPINRITAAVVGAGSGLRSGVLHRPRFGWQSVCGNSIWTIPVVAAVFAAVVLVIQGFFGRPVTAVSAESCVNVPDLPQCRLGDGSAANSTGLKAVPIPALDHLPITPPVVGLCRIKRSGNLGVLFAALCRVTKGSPTIHQGAAGKTYTIDLDGLCRAGGSIMEQQLLPPDGCDDWVDGALRRFVRGNVRRVEMTGETLALVPANIAPYSQAFVNSQYSSLPLAGFVRGRLCFSIQPDRLLVREATP